MTRPSVFISYNHKDEQWKDRLVSHLNVLAGEGFLDLWDDRQIEAGSDWYPEIEHALIIQNKERFKDIQKATLSELANVPTIGKEATAENIKR